VYFAFLLSHTGYQNKEFLLGLLSQLKYMVERRNSLKFRTSFDPFPLKAALFTLQHIFIETISNIRE